ncbi:ArsR/SmtB family transcription factor [Luteimicrobium subarcticum]|uniref:ArsR/SmtB family transcription factor n=1 Tax=Luteimicrobium subarcticum TaxID=620910 RepID=UPI001FE5CBFD|nr:metalloregulator ArsR/SmtB family transcription factor [Luteimicrobium subarcticum]
MTTPLPLAPDDATASCCATPRSALSPERADEVATLLRSVADPTRVRLVAAIAAAPDGEVCICDLTGPFGLTQPTLSHHMRVLIDAGLVAREQRGRWAYFSLTVDARPLLAAALTSALPAAGDGR